MKERIIRELGEAVNRICLKAQIDMEIQSGDITPMMAAKLDDKIEELAEIILDVLKMEM